MLVTSAKVLCLDSGAARIGVAISDELALLAHPRPFIPAVPVERALRRILALVREERVELVLVGLPRNMDGSEGLAARRARQFVRRLQEALPCPVELVDERLSTVQAQALLRQSGVRARGEREKIDSASAAVVLQAYLDFGRGRAQ